MKIKSITVRTILNVVTDEKFNNNYRHKEGAWYRRIICDSNHWRLLAPNEQVEMDRLLVNYRIEKGY